MNTYQIQLNDQQIEDLKRLLEWGQEDRCEWMKHHDYDGDKADEAEQERIVGEGYDSILASIEDRDALWSTSCGRVELEVPIKVVETIAVSGDNQPAVIAALKEPSYLRAQLEKMDIGVAADHLSEAGLDQFNEDGASRNDRDDITHYILWMACHDINDEIHTAD